MKHVNSIIGKANDRVIVSRINSEVISSEINREVKSKLYYTVRSSIDFGINSVIDSAVHKEIMVKLQNERSLSRN